MMEKALNEKYIPCQCEIFEGVEHGVGAASGTNAEGWIDHAVEFWKKKSKQMIGLWWIIQMNRSQRLI